MKLFVMMPFAQPFSNVRGQIRRAASIAQVQVTFADEIIETDSISRQIEMGIRSSDACIADITGSNPNVVWEMGFALAIGKQVIPLAQHKEDIFFDIATLSTIIYSLSELDRTLIQELVVRIASLKGNDTQATPTSQVGNPDHANTSLALGLLSLKNTPYDLNQLIQRAKHQVLIAAQHHMYIVQNGDYFAKEFKKFLSFSLDRKINILMCDSEKKYAVTTWTYITSARYLDDLKNANRYFTELQQNFSAAGLGQQFRVKRVAFVPTTATFIDPELQNGLATFAPNFYNPLSGMRPFFVMTRRENPTLFDQAWFAYEQRMSEMS